MEGFLAVVPVRGLQNSAVFDRFPCVKDVTSQNLVRQGTLLSLASKQGDALMEAIQGDSVRAELCLASDRVPQGGNCVVACVRLGQILATKYKREQIFVVQGRDPLGEEHFVLQIKIDGPDRCELFIDPQAYDMDNFALEVRQTFLIDGCGVSLSHQKTKSWFCLFDGPDLRKIVLGKYVFSFEKTFRFFEDGRICPQLLHKVTSSDFIQDGRLCLKLRGERYCRLSLAERWPEDMMNFWQDRAQPERAKTMFLFRNFCFGEASDDEIQASFETLGKKRC